MRNLGPNLPRNRGSVGETTEKRRQNTGRWGDERGGSLRSLFPREEIAWLGVWTAAVLALASLPYVVGYLLTPSGKEYMGFFPYIQDSNSYLAKMQQGAHGQWLFHLTYSPEESTGTLAFIYYLLLGKVSALIGLPHIVTYHLARVVNGALLLLVVYAFIGQFLSHRQTKRVAFLLICFSAGLGWLALALGFREIGGELPIDVHFPDSTTFWSLFTFPHYLLAQALMLLACIWLIIGMERGSAQWSVAAGLAALALGLVLPFGVITVYSVWGGFYALLALKDRDLHLRSIPYFAIPFLMAAPAVVYGLYMSGVDAVYRGWTSQNLTITPGPLNLIVSYGLLLPLAVAGVVWILRRGSSRMLLIAAWTLVIPVLLYAPTQLQRRVIIGWHIVLAVSAAIGLVMVVEPWVVSLWNRKGAKQRSGKGLRMLVNSLIILTLPSTLLIVGLALLKGFTHEYPSYLYSEETDALAWLLDNTKPGDTVLSGWILGSFIPARAGNRVFVGHWAETIDSAAKTAKVCQFFCTNDREARLALLREYRIRYVYDGSEERALGNLGPADYLVEVYGNDRVKIYRFDDGQ